MIVCPEYPEGFKKGISASKINLEYNGAHPVILRVPSRRTVYSAEDRLPMIHKARWVHDKVKEFAPDIIHVQTEFVMFEFAYSYARKHKIPLVYTLHTLWEEYAPNRIRIIPPFIINFIVKLFRHNVFNSVDAVIAPGEYLFGILKKYNAQDKSYILPSGIDRRIFNLAPGAVEDFREHLFQKEPVLKGRRILLYAGRIDREKNVDFLLRTAPDIIKKHDDVVFLLIGGGSYFQQYLKNIKDKNLENYFYLPGFVDRKELAYLYTVSDVFVFPSRTETQGLVTHEAMLSGLPVVAIGEAGTVGIMEGDNGGFMTRNDTKEFALRVNQLLEDETLRVQKSEEAKNTRKN